MVMCSKLEKTLPQLKPETKTIVLHSSETEVCFQTSTFFIIPSLCPRDIV